MHGLRVGARIDGTMADSTELTRLLRAWSAGDTDSRDQAVSLVYERLRALAARQIRQHGPMLQPTELANELFVKLAELSPDWQDRSHFFRATAVAMRNILLDLGRSRAAAKRGGGDLKVTMRVLDDVAAPTIGDAGDLYEALSELRGRDPRKADVIELVYLVGLDHDETADVLGLSLATVNRDLRFARAWLKQRLAT